MRSMSAVESHEQRLRPTMPAVTADEQPRSGHANETIHPHPVQQRLVAHRAGARISQRPWTMRTATAARATTPQPPAAGKPM